MEIKKGSIVLVTERDLKPDDLSVCFVTEVCEKISDSDKDNHFQVMDLNGEETEIAEKYLMFLMQSEDVDAKTAKEAVYSSCFKLVKLLGYLYKGKLRES